MSIWSLLAVFGALGSQNGAAFETRPPPPPPLPMSGESPDYWRSLQPIWLSKEEVVSCRNYGEVSAKFQYQNGIVRVIDIQGLSHRISPFERTALNAALTDFGYLDRVSIGCNLRDDALITVTARPTKDGGRRMVRRLSIVWTKHAMTGIGGRPRPVQESGEDLYG
ncbi:hypothetical protein PX554_03025 [Sphingomonas sp. H39-1-10]|uniref:hypothetical protein n=1 Tax=Sphingomonas pollutisoli TaxID=3030829 RepID=UPI0023B9BB13|nr:hypothetical protein [Sphingomonas pollutisoli]MDF0487092.1 hypothetical protein [Sphingomonas pollutisoli]